MASLQTSSVLFSASPSCSSSKKVVSAAIRVPRFPNVRFTTPKLPTTRPFVEDLSLGNVVVKKVISTTTKDDIEKSSSTAATQLYAILEAVADRIEMHHNVGEQRDNWNNLLLNSINMISLTATTMAGVAEATSGNISGLKVSSTILFSAAAGMLLMMNKLQPSQLAEEQRNAERLFKELKAEIEAKLALGTPSQTDVKNVMTRVLALDKAYPLPLLGKMLEKFPATFKPAVWWPKNGHMQQERKKQEKYNGMVTGNNGWNEELEMEMREIVKVLKIKDTEEYMTLGNEALKINKILAISGPLLTGIAAIGSAFVGSDHGSWAAVIAVLAGSLASTVNTFEHGGQVGMVFEMYRNSAGLFKLMEETIESTLEESDLQKRENGELFEMKMALKLGRSLSELRSLANKSNSSRIEGVHVDEFASKLF